MIASGRQISTPKPRPITAAETSSFSRANERSTRVIRSSVSLAVSGATSPSRAFQARAVVSATLRRAESE